MIVEDGHPWVPLSSLVFFGWANTGTISKCNYANCDFIGQWLYSKYPFGNDLNRFPQRIFKAHLQREVQCIPMFQPASMELKWSELVKWRTTWCQSLMTCRISKNIFYQSLWLNFTLLIIFNGLYCKTLEIDLKAALLHLRKNLNHNATMRGFKSEHFISLVRIAMFSCD